MDWDKCNFKHINQRKSEAKRWEKRDGEQANKSAKKGTNHQSAKKKKRKPAPKR